MSKTTVIQSPVTTISSKNSIVLLLFIAAVHALISSIVTESPVSPFVTAFYFSSSTNLHPIKVRNRDSFPIDNSMTMMRISRLRYRTNLFSKMTQFTNRMMTTKSSSFPIITTYNYSSNKPKIIIIPESTWRSEALLHSQKIRSLLKPGLTSIDDPINSGIKHQRKRISSSSSAGMKNHKKNKKHQKPLSQHDRKQEQQFQDEMQLWTSLDGKNPTYNFLIEYYGLKGAKGPRRLARWSPDPNLFSITNYENVDNNDHCNGHGEVKENKELDGVGIHFYGGDYDNDYENDELISAILDLSQGQGGIFLQNANEDDLGGILHFRGAIPITTNEITTTTSESDDMKIPSDPTATITTTDTNKKVHGILYNPSIFYNKHTPIESEEQKKQLLKVIAPFQWYESILQTTLKSDPVLHCHGLHEWAMLYHPPNAPPPPSAKYQSHLPLRVSREVINEAVERRGTRCTHVDALRFFAPAAGPLNHHGSSLLRTDQTRLEQKGCVHAHMDLLKIALKLQPFIDPKLLRDVLEVSIAARKLDVEASPYDVSEYNGDGAVVAVETEEGRKLYRSRQRDLMNRAEPVRRRLLDAYHVFMRLAFKEEFVGTLEPANEIHIDNEDNNEGNCNNDGADNESYAAPERFAKAEPGGLPWRKNLIET